MNPRSVLITGANRGIGMEIVKLLLQSNTPPTHLFATCRDISKAEELKQISEKHSNLKLIELEVTSQSAIDACASKVTSVLGDSGLNLLINNAGLNIRTGLEDTTMDGMMENFRVNVTAPFALSKAFLPLLRAAAKQTSDAMSCSRAAIVNVSSLVGSMQLSTPGIAMYPYRTSKAALNMVTRALSLDLKSDGILVVAYHPGWVKTDMGGEKAPLEVESSGNMAMGVFSSLNESHSGRLVNYRGETLPW